MRKILKGISTKEEIDKIIFIHFFLFSILLLGTIYEGYYYSFDLWHIFKIGILVGAYRLHLKTIKNLYYTFWTLTTILSLYILNGLSENSLGGGEPRLFYIYVTASLLLFLICYLLLSPIYFPRIAWWEYDFRFRKDMKISILADGTEYPGRLTDLRRNAGCIVSFESFEIGTVLKISAFLFGERKEIEVVVCHRREDLVGRGFNYGVKFMNTLAESKPVFNNFMAFWKLNKIARKRKKFVDTKR